MGSDLSIDPRDAFFKIGELTMIAEAWSKRALAAEAELALIREDRQPAGDGQTEQFLRESGR